MAEEKGPRPEEKPKPEDSPPAPPEQDEGQQTIITRQPSRFEQLVDKVLKKHKI